MNYANYDDSIVQARKVKIVGWPSDIAFASPSTIGNLKDMRTLHDGWLCSSIRWVRMSAPEVKAHADDLQRRRDEGQTIGKKRKRRSTKKKQPTTSEDTNNRAPELSDDQNNNVLSKHTGTAKRAKRSAKAQMAPKSRDLITDSDDDNQEEDATQSVVIAGGIDATAGKGRMMGLSAGLDAE